ncbi:MAG: AsmA family protein, partial [Vicinamibacterales bacterium]
MSRWHTSARILLRLLAVLLVGVLTLVVIGAGLLRTDWAHERMRVLVLSQAHRWLNASLDIARIEGSLLSGIELSGVSLTADDGARIVDIQKVAVVYNLRQLFTDGTVIDSITLDRPRIVAQQVADGRWNLTSLIRRETPSAPSKGGRRIRINTLTVHDGSATFRTPITLGIAHVPTEMSAINAGLSIETRPGAWTIGIESLAFTGAAPQLQVQRIEGAIDGGTDGWALRSLRVVTDRSEFLTDGRVTRRDGPSQIDFTVNAARFDFQEWGGVITAVSSINVRSAFDARLTGLTTAMQTTLGIRSSAGDIAADVLFDTTRPGWHGKGFATVQRLDLAPWLGKPDRPSDISGRIDFDLDLVTPRKFPRGTFAFNGAHAAYLNYEADDVTTTGVITDTDVRISAWTATAYGSNMRLTAGTIALDEPYAYTFRGRALGVDLRQVPANVPVPHVSSVLNFDFDVNGQFAESFLRGSAAFAESTFLDATLGGGANGSIDTHSVPFRYSGEGDLSQVDLNRFGRELRLDWLADPRYDGTLSGHFSVEGTGSDAATMTMRAGGRIARANMFGGALSDAEVTAIITDGSLDARFDGRIDNVNPALASGIPTYRARLSGNGRGSLRVQDLLVRTTALDDYTLTASLAVENSTVRDVPIQRGEVEASMSSSTLSLAHLRVTGPSLDADASGSLELDGTRSSHLTYHVGRGDLARLDAVIGPGFAGSIATTGTLTGTTGAPRASGSGTAQRLEHGNVELSTGAFQYDVTLDPESLERARGTITLQLSNLSAAGQVATALSGTIDYAAGYVNATLDATRPPGQAVHLEAELNVQPTARVVDIASLALSSDTLAW